MINFNPECNDKYGKYKVKCEYFNVLDNKISNLTLQLGLPLQKNKIIQNIKEIEKNIMNIEECIYMRLDFMTSCIDNAIRDENHYKTLKVYEKFIYKFRNLLERYTLKIKKI